MIVVNVIDLAELFASCCGGDRGGSPFAYRPRSRLLPRPAQIYTLVIAGILLGLLDGVLFGMVGVAEVVKAGGAALPAEYSPWPATRKHSLYWLPASAALGALGIIIALTCLAPAPLPEPLRALDEEGESAAAAAAAARDFYVDGSIAHYSTLDERGAYVRAPSFDRMPRSSAAASTDRAAP